MGTTCGVKVMAIGLTVVFQQCTKCDNIVGILGLYMNRNFQPVLHGKGLAL